MILKGKQALGKLGEDLSCDYLVSIGQRILERNWRCGHLEVDIISEDDFGVHFVEVKSRTAPAETGPEEKVDYLKRKKITDAALRYLNHRGPGGDREVFFDIISVLFDGDDHTVRYYPQAWIPMYT